MVLVLAGRIRPSSCLRQTDGRDSFASGFRWPVRVGNLLPPMEELYPLQNVIVFGESGIGKSSIINLVVGSQVAKTSPDVDACTTSTDPYDVTIGEKKYRLWDTPGLDGGSFGLFRAAIAEWSLKRFLRNHLQRGEPPLLIYCVRASRATRALVRHYQSVRSATRESENPVPMVIVATGLENSPGDMEDWWVTNAVKLSDHGMNFVDHACITSIDDDPCDPEHVRTRRTQSQDAVRELIFRNCIQYGQRRSPSPQAVGKREILGRRIGVVWMSLVSALLSGYKQ